MAMSAWSWQQHSAAVAVSQAEAATINKTAAVHPALLEGAESRLRPDHPTRPRERIFAAVGLVGAPLRGRGGRGFNTGFGPGRQEQLSWSPPRIQAGCLQLLLRGQEAE